MPVKKTPRGRTPSIPCTVQLPYEIGLDLEAKAEALGISRHRLFRLAFEVGLPLATGQINAPAAARIEPSLVAQIEEAARDLDIPRHRLFKAALQIGLPLAIDDLTAHAQAAAGQEAQL